MIYLIENKIEDFDGNFVEYDDLDKLKLLRLQDKRFDEILRDIGVFFLFLFFLYFVSFSNLSDSSFIYNELFYGTFIDALSPNEKGMNDVCVKFNLKIFTHNFQDH
jgi:hypothetical protein